MKINYGKWLPVTGWALVLLAILLAVRTARSNGSRDTAGHADGGVASREAPDLEARRKVSPDRGALRTSDLIQRLLSDDADVRNFALEAIIARGDEASLLAAAESDPRLLAFAAEAYRRSRAPGAAGALWFVMQRAGPNELADVSDAVAGLNDDQLEELLDNPIEELSGCGRQVMLDALASAGEKTLDKILGIAVEPHSDRVIRSAELVAAVRNPGLADSLTELEEEWPDQLREAARDALDKIRVAEGAFVVEASPDPGQEGPPAAALVFDADGADFSAE